MNSNQWIIMNKKRKIPIKIDQVTNDQCIWKLLKIDLKDRLKIEEEMGYDRIGYLVKLI